MAVQTNSLSRIVKKLGALQVKAVKLNVEMAELTKFIKGEEKKASVPAKKVPVKKPVEKKAPVKKVEVKTPVEAPKV